MKGPLGKADVVVVGGGVIGLAVARELARRDASVVLVERGALASEASWAAAGMLAPQVEADGRDPFFDFACESRDAYPAFADALREETGLDIELDCTGTLYLAFNEEDERDCDRRFEWQSRAGLIVERLTAEEARAHEPRLSPRVRAALRFPRAWQVENRKLCEALARSARAHGVEIRERTEARTIRAMRGRVSSVETLRGPIEAAAVVVACGAWSSLLPVTASVLPASSTGGAAPAPPTEIYVDAAATPRIEPVRGQILCYETGGEPLVRHVVYSPRGYVVPRRDGRLLAGTTVERAGFDKSVTDEGRRAIQSHAEEIAPACREFGTVAEWAGLRPRAADDLPVLGAHTEIEKLYCATGHYRNGILLAPLTGALIAELILAGEAPAPLAPFSPERFLRATARAF